MFIISNGCSNNGSFFGPGDGMGVCAVSIQGQGSIAPYGGNGDLYGPGRLEVGNVYPHADCEVFSCGDGAGKAKSDSNAQGGSDGYGSSHGCPNGYFS